MLLDLFQMVPKYYRLLAREAKKDFLAYRHRRRSQISFGTTGTEIDILNQPCGFVLSTGRCGTKWLTELLRFSSETWVEHDPQPKIYFNSQRVYYKNLSIDCLEAAFLHARFHVLEEIFRTGRHYVETNNRLTFYAAAIAKLMPNCRFVHLIRHPYKFIYSGLKRGWYGKVDPNLGGHIQPRPEEIIYEHWSKLERVEKIAWLWNRTNEIIEETKRSIYGPRVFFIRADEMWTSPQKVSDLLRFLLATDIANNFSLIRSQQRRIVNAQTGGFELSPEGWDESIKVRIRPFVPLASLYGFEL